MAFSMIKTMIQESIRSGQYPVVSDLDKMITYTSLNKNKKLIMLLPGK